MFRTWLEIILVFLIIGLGIYCIALNKKITKLRTNPKIEIVDSINTVIDTIYIQNDSLLNSLNESKAVVNRIDNDYKKNYIRIINQSSADDLLFFSEYIKSQEQRGLFSSNNCDSTKAD